MKPIRSQEQIKEMRKRLYERGTASEEVARHQLSDTKVDVSRNWEAPAGVSKVEGDGVVAPPPIEEKSKRHYRGFLLSGSLIIFILVATISGLFMYFGGNQISSDNIKISINGPSTVGGGEKFSFDVMVTNDNTVPIESATLILKFPEGTRTVGDAPRNLFEDRKIIDTLEPGEVKSVPIEVLVYGEEHAEKNIEATIEYRVDGSNGMFYKDSDPLAFRITSSPLVLRVKNIEKVASGQLVDITLTAQSNASSPLTDILVSASFPNGFSFESSEPAPVYGQNVWSIDELKPEESFDIKISGVVDGLTDENFRINFIAGPSDPKNQFLVGATLAEGWADYIIERPFINVAVNIAGISGRTAILEQGQESTVTVNVKNTLNEAVYDMVVEVVPGGNALNESSVVSNNGFYDSNTGTVRWEVANNPSFNQILPGDSRSLNFSVKPGPTRTTASYDLVVNVYARRIDAVTAIETLIGTVRADAKFSSEIDIAGQVALKSGPVPPKVGEETQYTLTLAATAGANDVTGGIIETSLPLYVEWLDSYEGDGSLVYNPVSKKLTWNVGSIPLNERKLLNFDVSMRPSISQKGSTPILLNNSTIKANDRFTSALLQDLAPAVTTELSKEMGYEKGNGAVKQ